MPHNPSSHARILFAACALLFLGGLTTVRAQENDCFKCSPPAQARAHRATRLQRVQQVAKQVGKVSNYAQSITPYPDIQSGNSNGLSLTGILNPSPQSASNTEPWRSPGLSSFDSPSLKGSGYTPTLAPSKRSKGNEVMDVTRTILGGALRQWELERSRRDQDAMSKRLEDIKRKNPPKGNSLLFPGARTSNAIPLGGRQPSNGVSPLGQQLHRQTEQFNWKNPNSGLFPAGRSSNGIRPFAERQPSNRISPFQQQFSRPSIVP